jgi:hypothetical protein
MPLATAAAAPPLEPPDVKSRSSRDFAWGRTGWAR